MSQRFIKGLTNNHLTWVMVDATDFATPESALSAATKIKVYGKLRGATGTNFVSSGTGSLTNDITHVGASALGIYTIALAKADLSDASAAWYDQYVISLSATGAAYQTLVVDGGIVESNLLALSDAVSNVISAVTVIDDFLDTEIAQINSRVLLTQSFASDAASAAAQGNSRILLVQSRLSDLDSRLASDLSDVLSGITALSGLTSDAHSAATLGASRALVIQSRLSDLDSRLVSDVSDIYSALVALSGQVSDTQSYLVAMSGMLSDTHSAAILGASHASDAYSAALLVQSRLSDFNSVFASDISDIVSALTVIDSRVLLTQSAASNAHSAAILAASYASDAHSAAALLTTAHTEPTGVPAANATPLNKIGFLFEALRNKVTVTSTKMQFFDDADAAQWEKDLSDDGTTYTETEANAI